jgi:DNA polymerase type B, organellar and viral
MSANKSTEKWRWVVYFDSESDLERGSETIRHRPKLICATFCDRERGVREERDYDGASLCQRFYKDLADNCYRHTTTYVFAHNVGYDLLATSGIRHLVGQGWHVDSLYEKGFTYILRLRGPEGKQLVFLSSTQFWNNKLAEVAPIFGLKKLETDHQTPDFEELRTYCRQDVKIVEVAMEWLQQFVAENDLGGMAMTLPSLAMKAFRHRFMGENAPQIHNYEPAILLERASYHGGRTEAWFLGKIPERVYKLDVNAMYPAVMRDCQHPIRLVRLYPQGDLTLLKSLYQRYFVIADLTIHIDEPTAPVKRDKLLFPVGTFSTVLCSPEISLLHPSQIVGVRAIACYERAFLFKSYVSFFYEERLKAKAAGERAKDELLKKYQNTLYGKFGQKSTEWVRVGDAPPDVTKTEDVYFPDGTCLKMRTFGGSTWINDGAVMESFDSFPAIAASVTSSARALLWRYIQTAGQSNVYYMDTDSLFVSKAGYDRLVAAGCVDSKALGLLKLEEESEDVEIAGAKQYRFGDHSKHKGIPMDAEIIDTPEGPRAKVWQWPKVASFLRDQQLDGFENRLVLKSLSTTYDKGTTVGGSGRVSPLSLQE